MRNNRLGIASLQFCSSLLQNWDLNTHIPRKPLHIKRMQQAGALLNHRVTSRLYPYSEGTPYRATR